MTPTYTPTAEQLAVLEAVRRTKDNIIIHALAGAAKTSTLVLIAKALSSTPILSLAFNTRINKEMKERMPGNVESLTLNSIGHRTWASFIGKRLIVDEDKNYGIVKALIEDLHPADKEEGYKIMGEVVKNVRQGKQAGYVPSGKFVQLSPNSLMEDEEFFASLDEEPSALMEELIHSASFISINQAFQGTIDYDDQILMPTVFHGIFKRRPVILGDEIQDWSALNHAMLHKIVGTNRFIGVGDENQAIYAFRGAHSDSMHLVQQAFSMSRFDLSICFRCPQLVIKEARSRAPSMQWPDWAEEGEVRNPVEWSIADLPADVVILCRNNAPLFRMAIRLLQNGRYPELVGSDIGKKIVSVMKKLGPGSTPREAAYTLVEAWKTMKLEKARDKAPIHDQAECMGVFIEQGLTLGDAIAYAEHLITISGNIKMMTGHKAKGLEWDHVFLLERSLLRMDHGQDKNLLYVMQTRARKTLTYVTMEGFRGV